MAPISVKPKVKKGLLELIRRTSSDLPQDVEQALVGALAKEEQPGAKAALQAILDNVALARQGSTPICQDTGTNLYFVEAPRDLPQSTLEDCVLWATREATRRGYLRPNVVDPVTGRNTGDNVGPHNPQIHWHEHREPHLSVHLLLKGGGSENVSIQYTLPDAGLKAGRDLAGVERCILDAAHRAQGKGCSPGILGIGVGGDRLSSFLTAKQQLLRPLHDVHPDAALAELEARVLEKVNSLGIGAMGFGGQTTALGVKIGKAGRLPASYFVSVAYMCWACRRHTLTVQPDGRYQVV